MQPATLSGPALVRRARLHRRVRALLVFFVAALVVSGVTAFPIESELRWLTGAMGAGPSARPEEHGALLRWLLTVREGLGATNRAYPFLAYGTDWLAFAHLVIAVLFVGPLRDPVRNRWVIEWGMIACIAVIPLALIAGEVRGIPFWWRLIDCSFGVFGIVPLWLCWRDVREMERLDSRAGRHHATEPLPDPRPA
ncbi:MAG TPA: hypothetical protein VFR81_03595 [Longimicrobium sp.]|nr:hypothetical protein [Longimicrobium sp.]